MQTAALLSAVAVAVGVLRLGESSPLPTVAAAAVSPPNTARRHPPADANTDTLSRLLSLSESTGSSSSSSSSRSPETEAGRTVQKREASPSVALMARLTRHRSPAHSHQKREASPVTGTSLSINNPIRVLRNRLVLQMIRRLQDKVNENTMILTAKGKRKRSVKGQLDSPPRRTVDDRFTEDMKQWLLS